MSELKVFQNEEFGAVRTMTINGEPYFVGKDVADILGYSNSRKALIDHVDEEDKNTVTALLCWQGCSRYSWLHRYSKGNQSPC